MTANQSSHPIEVFISYAHEDEREMKELFKHLKMLKREGLIAPWTDQDITAGREWEGKIHEKLESADLILLLISADFIASDYCWDVEMTRAMERHDVGEARVIPVIIKHAEGWNRTPFAKLQALPKWAQPVTDSAVWPCQDKAWVDVVHGLRRVVSELKEQLKGSS